VDHDTHREFGFCGIHAFRILRVELRSPFG
jgi:hypothetical protein